MAASVSFRHPVEEKTLEIRVPPEADLAGEWLKDE
jgi:hypothetical protein